MSLGRMFIFTDHSEDQARATFESRAPSPSLVMRLGGPKNIKPIANDSVDDALRRTIVDNHGHRKSSGYVAKL
eukprot:3111679-Heterocapsa_arctica.AAC.1